MVPGASPSPRDVLGVPWGTPVLPSQGLSGDLGIKGPSRSPHGAHSSSHPEGWKSVGKSLLDGSGSPPEEAAHPSDPIAPARRRPPCPYLRAGGLTSASPSIPLPLQPHPSPEALLNPSHPTGLTPPGAHRPLAWKQVPIPSQQTPAWMGLLTCWFSLPLMALLM